MRHLGRRGMSVGEVAGTGQNETRGLSDVGEDGVMKGLRSLSWTWEPGYLSCTGSTGRLC